MDTSNICRGIIILVVSMTLNAGSTYGECVLDFQQGDDLRVLFDGGLRPCRVPGLDRSHLEVGQVDILLILTTGESFRMPIQQGGFTVVEGNKLSSCDLIGQLTSVNEAAALAKTICGSLKEPAIGLDHVLSTLGATPEPSNFWSSSNIARGNCRLKIKFLPVFGYQKLAAKVSVSLSWARPRSEMNPLLQPIKPPPGYEGVSMEPQARSRDSEQLPKHGPEYYRGLMVAANSKGLQKEFLPTPKAVDIPANLNARRHAGTAPASEMWMWTIGFITLIFVFVLAFMHRRK